MKHFFCLLFVVSAQLIYGQLKSDTYEPVLPTSPNVEEFTKYVNFPVKHYTGVPNISIPMYSLSIKGFQSNIALNYHAGGIRVNERASWVGLGWNMNAGGVITREVRGTPDDLEYGYSESFSGVGQDMENFFSADFNITPENEDFVKNIRNQAADGWIDTQPDIYTFKVGGLSGRFIINYDGQIYQLSHNAIKISGNPQNGFQITDTSGNAYFFDQIEQTMVVPSNMTGGDDYTYNSSWHLSKITNPFHQEILFSYHSEGMSFQAPLQQSISYRTIGNHFQCDPMLGTSSPNIFLNIQAKRLSEITFPSGTLKFVALTDRNDVDGNSKQLDRIEIWNDTKLLKKYEFNYDYFMPAEKLKLVSIQEFSVTNQSKLPFRFYYNETHPLPAIDTKGQDFWGYYNGKDNNNTLLPLLPDYVVAGIEDYNPDQHADREVDPIYADTGTLSKIIYPTEGSTEYFYESNAYGYIKNNSIAENQRYTGGLRIKKIVKKDEAGDIALEKQYKYLMEDEIHSSGVVLTTNPPYGFPRTIRTSYNNLPTSTVLCDYYYITSVPLTSYGSSQGSVTGYRRVIEKTISNQDGITSNGERVYEFTSAYDFDDDYEFYSFPYSERISFDYRRGLPLKETHYSIKNMVKEKIRETENNYMFLEQPFTNVWAMKAGRNTTFVAPHTVYDDDYLTTVSLNKYVYGQSYGAFLSRTVTKTYPTSGIEPPVMVSRDIIYDKLPYPQPSEEQQVTNFGDTISTRYTYAFDNLAEATMTALVGQNRVAEPVQTQTYQIDALGDEQLLTTQKTLYKDWGNDLLLPEKIQTSKSGENLKDLVRYEDYDTFGNPLEIVRADNTSISYIWGYGQAQPIAKLEGISYSEIDPVAIANLQTLSDNDTDALSEQTLRNVLNALRSSHPDAVITTFTYDPLVGVTSSTDPKGYTSFYTYDDFNRLAATKDTHNDIVEAYSYNYAQYPPLNAVIEYGSAANEHQWFAANLDGGSGNFSYAWFEGVDDSSTTFEVSPSGANDTYQFMVNCGQLRYVKLVVTDTTTGETMEAVKASNNTCNYPPLNASINYGPKTNSFQWFLSTVNGGSGNYSYAWYKGIGSSNVNFENISSGTASSYQLFIPCTEYKYVKLVVTDTVTGLTVSEIKFNQNNPCTDNENVPEMQ
ncbi:MAG: hypothetical protein AAF934_01415 [Bacteroidota bacterium]